MGREQSGHKPQVSFTRRDFLSGLFGAGSAVVLGADRAVAAPAAGPRVDGGVPEGSVVAEAKKPAFTINIEGRGNVGPIVNFRTEDQAINAHHVPMHSDFGVRGRTRFTAEGIGAWVSMDVQTPYLWRINISDPRVKRDEQGALILPIGSYIQPFGTTDITKAPARDTRTEPMTVRLKEGTIGFASGAEFLSINVEAATRGDSEGRVDFNFAQLHIPGKRDGHDNTIILPVWKDSSEEWFNGPIMRMTGAVSEHAVFGVLPGPDGLLGEENFKRSLEISGGTEQKRVAFYDLWTGQFGYYHSIVGPRPASGRRNLPYDVLEAVWINFDADKTR